MPAQRISSLAEAAEAEFMYQYQTLASPPTQTALGALVREVVTVGGRTGRRIDAAENHVETIDEDIGPITVHLPAISSSHMTAQIQRRTGTSPDSVHRKAAAPAPGTRRRYGASVTLAGRPAPANSHCCDAPRSPSLATIRWIAFRPEPSPFPQ
ncbi:MAG TPA: hypothetical protein VN959_10165, partial [Mycobacterium sp.]|nr:hypothetical protein [Mycobacterium sp.]